MGVQEPVADRGGKLAAVSRSTKATIMSSAEMPPEQVIRLPSISNREGVTATSGKSSLKAG